MLAPGPTIAQKAVLLIAPQPFFVQRGTPINVRAMAGSLAELGYDVDLLVFPLGNEIEIPGVRVLRSLGIFGIKSVPIGPSWRKLGLDFFLFLKAARLILFKRYAAVQGIEEGGFMAWLLGLIARIPSIFDMDSCMVTQLESSGFVRSNLLLRFLSSIEVFCIKRSSAVITVCQALTEKVQEFAPQARIYQIEDFPLDGLENIAPRTVQTLKSEFSLANKRIALYTGNFESYQGIDLLLESFARARDRMKSLPMEILLVLVGGDHDKIEFYKQRSRELNIGDTVLFTGPRPAEEMGAFMSLAEVLVSPRLHGNNTPLKLYSYMAMGKVIVATDIQSHSQVLTNDSAYLAAPNTKDFGDALYEVFEQSAAASEKSKSRAERAKDLVTTRYSKDCFAQKLKSLYSELIGPPMAEGSP